MAISIKNICYVITVTLLFFIIREDNKNDKTSAAVSSHNAKSRRSNATVKFK